MNQTSISKALTGSVIVTLICCLFMNCELQKFTSKKKELNAQEYRLIAYETEELSKLIQLDCKKYTGYYISPQKYLGDRLCLKVTPVQRALRFPGSNNIWDRRNTPSLVPGTNCTIINTAISVAEVENAITNPSDPNNNPTVFAFEQKGFLETDIEFFDTAFKDSFISCHDLEVILTNATYIALSGSEINSGHVRVLDANDGQLSYDEVGYFFTIKYSGFESVTPETEKKAIDAVISTLAKEGGDSNLIGGLDFGLRNSNLGAIQSISNKSVAGTGDPLAMTSFSNPCPPRWKDQ